MEIILKISDTRSVDWAFEFEVGTEEEEQATGEAHLRAQNFLHSLRILR